MVTDTKIDPFSSILEAASAALEKRITTSAGMQQAKFKKLVDTKIAELDAKLMQGSTVTIRTATSSAKLSGLKHKDLQTLITITAQNIPCMLVGMAGTGKTHAAEQVASALELPFYSMSVGAQTSKSDILGFIHAGGEYIPSLFRKAYESGGVFLMDELDAGNANVLIQVNAALANGYCSFPDGMVKRHKNFRFIGTANTYGNGANRQYVGRNQLDAATLDRFAILDWIVDESLEAKIVAGYKHGFAWHTAVKAVRTYCADMGLRILVTPRTTIRGARLLDAGLPLDEVIALSLTNSVIADKQSVITGIVRDNYHYSEVSND